MVHLHSIAGAASPSRVSALNNNQQTSSTPAGAGNTPDVGFQSFLNLFGSSPNPSAAKPTTGSSANPTTTSTSPSGSPTIPVSTPTTGTSTLATRTSDAVGMLTKALVAEGMDPSGVKMTYQELNPQYPGGSYTIHEIKCDLSNGKTVFIDADAMKLNPEIAALDVRWVQQSNLPGTNAGTNILS